LALHRILVVDDSPAIRETLAILLSREYEVRAMTVAESAAQLGRGAPIPSAIIAGASDRARQAIRQLPARVPVLWLVEDGQTPLEAEWLEDELIQRRFSPHELRRRVETLISKPRAERADEQIRQRLLPPYLTPEVSRIVAEALGNDLPLFLCGEPGTGKRSVARIIHAMRGGGRFRIVGAAGFPGDALAADGLRYGTLFIDSVDQLGEQAQLRLLALLEPNGMLRTSSGTRLRLITAATRDLAETLECPPFSRELYYRLTVLKARFPPLRDRVDDIPKIVRLLAADLARWLGLPALPFTPRALERLSKYLWFGNLAELESVLARTLSIRRKGVIDADDLIFETTRLMPRDPAADRGPAAPTLGEVTRQNLDLIINELAHEFKNPLVTIKTFAQHLVRALQEGGDQEQAARLTGQAVDQIDGALENLLQFTRFDVPARRPLALDSLVTPVVEEFTPALEARGACLSYEPPPPVTVLADPEQTSYALSNLLRALCRDIGSNQSLAIRHRHPAGIEIQLPEGADPLGGHLAAYLDQDAAAEAAQPLGMAIASVLLERNGAKLAVEREAGINSVTIRFAVAEDEEALVVTNGKPSHTDR
jgi:two-component system response regulator PilR (NtrC family)